MEMRRAIVSCFLRTVLNTIAKIDCREFIKALSNNKPMIVIVNHINFLEVPILVSHSYPLYVTGLVKAETWKNPFIAFLANTYKAIPIDRRGAFAKAFKKVRDKVDAGYFVCIAPEGTRSKNGVLGHGKAGIVELSLCYDIPILPVAHHGGENIWKNLKRFKRTPFYFKAGKPFRIKFEGRPCKEEREEIMTEAMRQIAKLLPPQYRGVYAENTESKIKYLEFLK